MHEETRALDVAQELQPQPGTLARALDQTGYIGHNEGLSIHADHAEHRRESGKRIVAYLRLGRAHSRQQSRLADVGIAYETYIGYQLQFHLDSALFARLSLLGDARCLL